MWAFLAPAFEEHNQRSMAAMVAFATVLGLGGVAFGYFVILPPAIHFLTNYDSAHYTILIRARDYYSFVDVRPARGGNRLRGAGLRARRSCACAS